MTVSNTTPGWYPDNTDPSRVRYWDGQNWTDHSAPAGSQPAVPGASATGSHPPITQPMGAQPGAYPGPPAAPPPGQQNWFMRHKVLTAVLAVVLIGIIAAAAGGGGSDDPEKADDDTKSSVADKPDTKDKKDNKGSKPKPESEPEEESEPEQPQGTLPLEDGDWRLESVSLKDDGLGSFGGDARITYIGEDTNASNIFTVTVLDENGDFVASLDGSAEGMDPNGTETVALISFDDWKPGNYKFFDFQKGL